MTRLHYPTQKHFLLKAFTICFLLLSFTANTHALSIPELQGFVDNDNPNTALAYENGDAITWSYQLLADQGVISADEIPFTPSGKSPYFRIFTRDANVSNDHLLPPDGDGQFQDAFRRQNAVVFDQDGDVDSDFNFNHFSPTPVTDPPTVPGAPVPTSRLYFGADWTDPSGTPVGDSDVSGSDIVDPNTNWTMAGDLNTWLDGDAPVFALDFSQTGTIYTADLWVKARGIFVKKSALEDAIEADNTGDGVTHDEFSTILATLLSSSTTGVQFSLWDSYADGDTDENNDGLVNSGAPAGTPLDNTLIDTTSGTGDGSGANVNPTDEDFVLTPSFLQGINVDGSRSDWGAVFPELNLGAIPDFVMFVEWQERNNNDGIDDIYIVKGVIIPTPAAGWLGVLGFGLLATFRRKRKSA